jgi:DNA helicase-2/ATP-dependent DNA helicase PcrA
VADGLQPKSGRLQTYREGNADEAALFQTLRQWRRVLSEDAEVPAFVIMPDTTLRALARHQPKSLEELAQVKGIGPAKLEHYGEALLRLIHDHE